MDHNEAVEKMAAERYLLDELAPALRDSFEEHYFDCAECALDLRAAAAFVAQSKWVFPSLPNAQPLKFSSAASPSDVADALPAVASPLKRNWFEGWNPFLIGSAFAAPALASLLFLVGYQNLVTIPALRSSIAAADEPQLVPWVSLRPLTRGSAPTVIHLSRHQSFVLPVDLDKQNSYASYSFALYDSAGKVSWSETDANAKSTDAPFSLLVPSKNLEAGGYVLVIAGIGLQGGSVEVDRRAFELQFIH